MVTTYDPASYELAEHFLQDEPCRNDPPLYAKHCDDLVKHIQRAVEDWFISPAPGIINPLVGPTKEQEEYLCKIHSATASYDPSIVVGGPNK